jgi:hypothetical protein
LNSIFSNVLSLRRYTNIHIGPPCLEEEYRQEEITPQQCRLRDITYAGEAMACWFTKLLTGSNARGCLLQCRLRDITYAGERWGGWQATATLGIGAAAHRVTMLLSGSAG